MKHSTPEPFFSKNTLACLGLSLAAGAIIGYIAYLLPIDTAIWMSIGKVVVFYYAFKLITKKFPVTDKKKAGIIGALAGSLIFLMPHLIAYAMIYRIFGGLISPITYIKLNFALSESTVFMLGFHKGNAFTDFLFAAIKILILVGGSASAAMQIADPTHKPTLLDARQYDHEKKGGKKTVLGVVAMILVFCVAFYAYDKLADKGSDSAYAESGSDYTESSDSALPSEEPVIAEPAGDPDVTYPSAIKMLMKMQGVETAITSVRDKRAEGGEKTFLITYNTTTKNNEEFTNETRFLVTAFLGSSMKWDIDGMYALIRHGNTSNIVEVNKELKARYFDKELTLGEVLRIAINGE